MSVRGKMRTSLPVHAMSECAQVINNKISGQGKCVTKQAYSSTNNLRKMNDCWMMTIAR